MTKTFSWVVDASSGVDKACFVWKRSRCSVAFRSWRASRKSYVVHQGLPMRGYVAMRALILCAALLLAGACGGSDDEPGGSSAQPQVECTAQADGCICATFGSNSEACTAGAASDTCACGGTLSEGHTPVPDCQALPADTAAGSQSESAFARSLAVRQGRRSSRAALRSKSRSVASVKPK